MKNVQRLALLAVVAFLVAACEQKPRIEGTRSTFSPGNCPTSNQGSPFRKICKVDVIEDSKGPYTCELGKFRIEPDELQLVGTDTVTIQWHLSRGFSFCEGDGATLKEEIAIRGRLELLEKFRSENDVGQRAQIAASACLPHENWTWANQASGGTKYYYQLQFSDRSGKKCTIDPFIKNGR